MYLGHGAVAQSYANVRSVVREAVPAMLQEIRDNSTQTPGVRCDFTRWVLSGVRGNQKRFSLRLYRRGKYKTQTANYAIPLLFAA